MQCLTCTNAKELTGGNSSITLGTIASLNADVYIYVENTANGKQFRQEATTDGAGVVVLDTTDPSGYTYDTGADYNTWVTLQTGDISDAQTITIDTVGYECLRLRFAKPVGSNNQYVTDAAQTVEVV